MAPIALLSVSNKEGLVPFAKALIGDFGFQIISSGGTAKLLEQNKLPVERVADFTGAPEILGGRVKTLHPKVHGGILAARNNPNHKSDLKEHKIPEINLVVVNLYPFEETVEDPNVSWEKAIENIDIGGPTMIRAAAKNHEHVVVLTRPDQYKLFLTSSIKSIDEVSKDMRQKLALEAFAHTAAYDAKITNWISKKISQNTTSWVDSLPIKQKLRYGENPHQLASWYSENNKGWGEAKQLQGKELSMNNLLDLESALTTIKEFGYKDNAQNSNQLVSAAVVIKHNNPCGVATCNSLENALKKALDADRVSAFGGIVALNQKVTENVANELKCYYAK